jgi:hypothetical protein
VTIKAFRVAVRGYVADDGSLWRHDSELSRTGASHSRVPLVALHDAEREIAARDARIAQLTALSDEQHACIMGAVEAARSELPDWSRPILAAVLRWYRDRQRDARATHEAVVELEAAVRDGLEWLSECGIETMK